MRIMLNRLNRFLFCGQGEWLNRLNFPVKEGVFFVYVIIDNIDVKGRLLFSFGLTLL